ncbi:MAG: beta strand repeat-containing protein, partial [Ferruginibacter sp.]
MKKILSLLTALLAFALVGFSQAPGFFNYQGVARNSVGNVLKNQSINLRLTITDGTANGPSVYQESRQLVTNPFGLFNVQVGSGGASNVSGTISGVNWSVGAKFIKVEIDPAGGTNFLSIGSAQLASVPFSLFATTAGDIVLPFNKTQSDAGSLFKVTNSGSVAGSTALEGLTNSQAGNASAVIGTVTNTTPGGFSAGVKGINNGTGGLGIGVYGVQNGSGSGVYGTTPSGIGVNGNSTSGTGVNGTSNSGVGVAGTSTSSTAVTGTSGTGVGVAGTSTSNTAVTGTSGSGVGVAGTSTSNTAVTGTSGTGVGVAGISTSANAVSGTSSTGAGVAGTSNTGFGGFFEVTNPASTADAVRAVTGGTGASWAIRGISTGTNGAGLFQQTNATNTSNNLQSNQAGLGRAGLFNSTNAASTANAVDINVAGTGFALRAASSNATPKALLTSGGLQLTGIGEAANSVLVSDATGNATWQTVGAIGAVTGSGTLAFIPKWTPSGTQLGNSLLFDDGSSIGLGTTTPTHRLNVSHSGSTGIGVTSTSGFSVIDIDAASGDAALRFARAGVNQWNTRNRPADDYYEIFELGGGGGSRFVIQDGTGNVGIGETANPTYKLDVLHGGSTGIRSRSSSSFSVIDIDGQSGDAALRFAKAGVNQWNIRNRPADDYLEIFELGGGGSRFVIQDATGNVGIGETTSPSYKLDVLHGGSTGIRSRSSSSFSVVDIDAASGDAALRFAKAGVNQWNTRNRPADDYYEIFELGGGGSRFVIQDGTGNVGIGETTAPSYKLDVLHGGSTGIRSRSESSFSVVDIDAASGDAALRFAKAGVNQWNTRNRPADDYYEIFELGGGGSRFVIQDGT